MQRKWIPPKNKDLPVSRLELLQGTLDLLILQTLLWGPRHGYGIAQMIHAGSGDVLQVETEILETRPCRSKPNYGIIRLRNVTKNQRGEIVQSMTAHAMVPRRLTDSE